jgi:branched-subunit amino acid aminotransferase/4-amino-4-deoxychorismate lyase
MLTGNKLITPPVSEGCLNGVMKAGLGILKKWTIWRCRRSDLALDLQNRRIIYHKRYQGNTAHNKIQEKRI